ncbi:epidermal retinol dehydrogenase 2-like [Tropilaelaps mercedesae]|uniref:Short-chain dehydrogenase/reductase 3 n=1 Tax=Tropilaelaps mercedesae TaxID=418985 RepID=A0A1V9XHJ5_9ACAR|nr:epidermal retinol dehydrogenase 2-like [Tropilaelaps mercedesae]
MADVSVAQTIAELLGVIIYMLYCIIRECIYLIVPRPRKSVKDKVVVLTGAGHGLGRLLAKRLCELGARCVLIDIDKGTNEAVASEIRETGQPVWAFQCDVSSEEQIKELHQRIEYEVGPVDIIINNAAIVNCLEILKLQSARIRRNFEINTLSHIWMIREFLPGMKERGSGHILAISSIAGMMGTAYLTDYCASKFAVRGLMMALEEELYEQGYARKIQLTTVCPVAINTGMFHLPQTRFPWVTPILEPDTVADGVIDALLTNQREVVLPSHIGIVNKIVSCLLPIHAVLKLQRFLSYGVSPHKETAAADSSGDVKKDI